MGKKYIIKIIDLNNKYLRQIDKDYLTDIYKLEFIGDKSLALLFELSAAAEFCKVLRSLGYINITIEEVKK